MGKTLNYRGTTIEDAFDSVSDGVSDVFDGESADIDFDQDDGELFTGSGGSAGELSKTYSQFDPETDETSFFRASDDSPITDPDAVKRLSEQYGAPKKSGFDTKKALQAASKFGAGAPQVIGKSSRLLDVDLPNLRGGRLPMPGQYPYAAPSYLQGSQAYNAQVGKLVNALLREEIRPRSIRSLI
jgi:hypothetical protein